MKYAAIDPIITTTDTDQVILLVDLSTMSVVVAAMDVPNQRQALLRAHPGSHPLTGPVAALLFTALTGRTLTTEPESATPARARQARIMLLGAFNQPGYDVALGILGCAGSILRPNLGATLLNQEGRIVPNTHLAAISLLDEPVNGKGTRG